MITSPPNAIGAAILNMTFTEWLKRSIPIFLITFPLMVTALTLYFKPNRKISIGVVVFKKNKAAPLKTLAAIFLTAVLLWTTKRILSPLLNIAEGFNRSSYNFCTDDRIYMDHRDLLYYFYRIYEQYWQCCYDTSIAVYTRY